MEAPIIYDFCTECGPNVSIDEDGCCHSCGGWTLGAGAESINKAVEIAVKYGGIDGSHHKDWVIDQMVRALTGRHYEKIVADACSGEDGPDTYSWNCGIAP